METAEQIISKRKPNGEYPSYYHESDIEEMMIEYAEQQAVAFGVFLTSYHPIKKEGRIIEWRDNWTGNKSFSTTKQLHELFLSQQNK